MSAAPVWWPYTQTVLELFRLGEDRLSLCVDLRVAGGSDLPGALEALGIFGSFAVVTAFNPSGSDHGTGRANAARNRRLVDSLHRRGAAPLARVDGCSPDRAHRETGFALALDETAAIALAREFAQDAIYWWDGGSFWLVGAGLGDVGRLKLPAPRER